MYYGIGFNLITKDNYYFIEKFKKKINYLNFLAYMMILKVK